MRILVVEDEKKIADFLQRGLESNGYAVDVAPDGHSAIAYVHDTDYDVVILDLMLPDPAVDGMKVLERIRSRKVGPPVLILSARGSVDDRVIGNGEPGPITREIQETYFAAVRGKADRYKDWLEYVN